MKKRALLGIIVGVVTVIATLVLAGNVNNKTSNIDGSNGMTNTAVVNSSNSTENTTGINSSYEAIKKAYAEHPLNSEISFIYNAINNKISEYPKTVPDFINLPVDSIIDVIDTSQRIHIEYADNDNYENGIIIAQEPAAGAAWDNGVIVNLTVNRKYSSLNSKRGFMCESSDKLYLLTFDSDNNYTGTIWADGEKLADGDITRIYADNGNVYYHDGNRVNKLNTEGISQVLEKEILQQVVYNEKMYYRDTDGYFYCYDMNDKTNSPVTNEQVIFLYANSDYIVCNSMHDIFILDSESYKIIKHINSEKFFISCSLDNDNVYYAETTFDNPPIQNSIVTKYNIKQDEQKTVFKTDALLSDIVAVDDKIILRQDDLNKNEAGIRYIDMRNMEEKYFTTDDDILDMDDSITDILFDGQQIIYEKEDGTVYSICIFTGETRKIDLISSS